MWRAPSRPKSIGRRTLTANTTSTTTCRCVWHTRPGASPVRHRQSPWPNHAAPHAGRLPAHAGARAARGGGVAAPRLRARRTFDHNALRCHFHTAPSGALGAFSLLPVGLIMPLHRQSRSVSLGRLHLEHDSAKSIHTTASATLVDLNRAGTRLAAASLTSPHLARLGSPQLPLQASA